MCALDGLWPEVDEPPSELSGGVRFWGFLLKKKKKRKRVSD